jgi:hypothetical protein
MNSASPSFSEIEFTIALPCVQRRPASITLHFELSIITGTLADGRLRHERGSGTSSSRHGVEHALVHVDVDDLRARSPPAGAPPRAPAS